MLELISVTNKLNKFVNSILFKNKQIYFIFKEFNSHVIYIYILATGFSMYMVMEVWHQFVDIMSTPCPNYESHCHLMVKLKEPEK